MIKKFRKLRDKMEVVQRNIRTKVLQVSLAENYKERTEAVTKLTKLHKKIVILFKQMEDLFE